MRFLIARYESVLRLALRNRLVVLALAVVVLAGSYVLYSSLGSECLPAFDESGAVITLKIKSEEAARFGVTPNDIANTVTIAMSGDASSSILEQGRLVAVRVLLPETARTSLDGLKSLTIRSTSGQLFRLEQVADVFYNEGQTEIERDGLRQSVAATARITGSDLGTTIANINLNWQKT